VAGTHFLQKRMKDKTTTIPLSSIFAPPTICMVFCFWASLFCRCARFARSLRAPAAAAFILATVQYQYRYLPDLIAATTCLAFQPHRNCLYRASFGTVSPSISTVLLFLLPCISGHAVLFTMTSKLMSHYLPIHGPTARQGRGAADETVCKHIFQASSLRVRFAYFGREFLQCVSNLLRTALSYAVALVTRKRTYVPPTCLSSPRTRASKECCRIRQPIAESLATLRSLLSGVFLTTSA
jgi:hypothetical protein